MNCYNIFSSQRIIIWEEIPIVGVLWDEWSRTSRRHDANIVTLEENYFPVFRNLVFIFLQDFDP